MRKAEERGEVVSQFKEEAKDYCKSFKLIVKEKLSFINQLQSVADLSDKAAFSDRCVTHIRGLSNSWFDPSIPHDIISETDMCDAYHDVFSELEARGQLNFVNSVQHSYMLNHQMHMSAMMQTLFDACNDNNVEDKKTNQDYCERNFMKKANFTLWEDHNKAKACSDSLLKTSEKCATRMEANGVAINSCHSCGYAISYLFSRYDNFVTTSMENVFADINEKIGQSMNEAEAEARLAKQGKVAVKVVNDSTGEESTVSS